MRRASTRCGLSIIFPSSAKVPASGLAANVQTHVHIGVHGNDSHPQCAGGRPAGHCAGAGPDGAGARPLHRPTCPRAGPYGCGQSTAIVACSLESNSFADQFLETQLKPSLLERACAQAGVPLKLRRHEDYDHSYFFISTFIEDHLRWHAQRLGVATAR